MKCTRCGTDFTGNFCPNCGEQAHAEQERCPVCGKLRANAEHFCADCGHDFTRSAAPSAPATSTELNDVFEKNAASSDERNTATEIQPSGKYKRPKKNAIVAATDQNIVNIVSFLFLLNLLSVALLFNKIATVTTQRTWGVVLSILLCNAIVIAAVLLSSTRAQFVKTSIRTLRKKSQKPADLRKMYRNRIIGLLILIILPTSASFFAVFLTNQIVYRDSAFAPAESYWNNPIIQGFSCAMIPSLLCFIVYIVFSR